MVLGGGVTNRLLGPQTTGGKEEKWRDPISVALLNISGHPRAHFQYLTRQNGENNRPRVP